MLETAKNIQEDLHLEFIKTIHAEKITTQSERATYITSKFAFIAGLSGLSIIKSDNIDFHWLLYFIPLVSIGYDLYIRATDISIKKIGTFLRNLPESKVSESEHAWEVFSAKNRDYLARTATTIFSYVVILAAAISIFIQQRQDTNDIFWVGFIIWVVLCMGANTFLWTSHTKQVKRLDLDSW